MDILLYLSIVAGFFMLGAFLLNQQGEIKDLHAHIEVLSESVDERFAQQLEIIQKLHTQVDGVETDLESNNASSLLELTSPTRYPSSKIAEGVKGVGESIKGRHAGSSGANIRTLRSAKDMTFNLAKPKKKQARKSK